MAKQYLTWDQTQYQIQWDNNPYTWDEVFILIGIAQDASGGGNGYQQSYLQLSKEKKKKVIKLIARVKGKKFKEEKYTQENIKVIAKEIEIIITELFIKKVD